jgi:hypothetical protein
MLRRSFHCWRWLEAQFAVIRGRGRRKLRRNHSPFTYLPAQIENLESRVLLTVTYNGGDIITNVNAQAVFIGSQWASNSALVSQQTQVNSFLSTIVDSSYMNMLTNAGYGVGLGTSTKGAVDNVTLGGTISDAQIQADIQAMIKAGTVAAPSPNQLYVVYVQPGVNITLGSDSSSTDFLGYHGAFSGTNASGQQVDIHYAVISYPGSPNFTAASQGFSSNLNEMTAVTSHELAESVTDPNVNYKTLGWYDATFNGEIGDLAEGNYATLGGFEVQDLVNQNDQLISPPTPITPTTIAAPTVTASSVNATTANLSWNSVSGATDYNIYYINGQITIFLGTVASSTTSINVNNLPSGSNSTFMVMAYDGTSSASSKTASVTLSGSGGSGGGGGGGGGQTGLAAPQVQVSSVTSSTAVLSWNRVSGAQGYRVYWLDGTQRVLIGTTRSTAVQITGMSQSTTYQFVVEAYNSTSVGDSSVVTVTTALQAARLDQVATWAALAGNPASPSQWLGGGHKHDSLFG